jgi:hypothetical protein
VPSKLVADFRSFVVVSVACQSEFSSSTTTACSPKRSR